jgi:peptide/nickel transport system permease protein
VKPGDRRAGNQRLVVEPATPDLVEPGIEARARFRTRAARRRWPFSVVLAAGFLAVVTVFAVFGPVIAPEADKVNLSEGISGPSLEHPLGTDKLGRGILARVVAGARTAVGGPLIMTTATLIIATIMGLAAAYRGGWLDSLGGRVIDLLYSLPALLVVIVVAGVLGGSYALAIAVLVVLNIPQNFRVIRAAALEQRVLPYVEAGESLGLSTNRILFRHLLPNIAPYIVSAFFLRFTFAIVELSAVSFLGLGLPPGSPDWGRMLAENRIFLEQNPWASIAPATLLVLTAASANILGDWLYEQFSLRGTRG